MKFIKFANYNFVYKNINAHHPDYDCVFNWLLFDCYQLVLIL